MVRRLAAALTALSLVAGPASADPKQTAEKVDKAVADWMQQQGVANFMLDVTPGGSWRFKVWAAAESSYRTLRAAARGPFHAIRRTIRKMAK